MPDKSYLGNDDATKERLSQASRSELDTPVLDTYLPTGIATGERYRKIETPLECAYRHSWIDLEHKRAGEKLLYHLIMSKSQIKYSTSKWELRVDTSLSHLNPFELKSHHAREARKALTVVNLDMREALKDWLIKGEQEDTSIYDLAELFGAASCIKSKDARRAVTVYALRMALEDLAVHFGYQAIK